MKEAVIDAPFNPVTGLGLGVSYSSLNQLGNFFPQEGLGQAKVGLYVNIISGNLIVIDRPVVIQELDGPLTMGFIYNSQASSTGNNWQFTLKRLTQLPIPNTSGSTVILQEVDGHLTTYTLGDGNIYSAPALNDGIPTLQYDSNKKLWCWYHPKTRMTEYYNAQGLLVQRADAVGNATTYDYDQNNNIQTITGASGNVYKILRTVNTITITQMVQNQPQILQSYTLDEVGRIHSTQTPTGYTTTYSYSSYNGISTIDQSDGTTFSAVYGLTSANLAQLQNFRVGMDISYRINGPTASAPNQASIQDGNYAITTFTFDPNTCRTLSISQQTGYNSVPSSEINTTTYGYNAVGQVATITYPDGSQTVKQYGATNAPMGLLSQCTDPNGQVVSYAYANDNNCTTPTYPLSQTQILNGTNLVTYFVYDPNYDGQNNAFLKYEISPEGRVTQYIPDVYGNNASIIKYLANFYPNPTDPTVAITLDQMQVWEAQQDPQLISRTDCQYNPLGQVSNTKKYANIDAQGNGIEDAFMGVEDFFWDEFGNLLTKEVLQTGSNTAVTDQRFDDLQRILTAVDAELNQTNYSYPIVNGFCEPTVILPNQCQTVAVTEASGLITQVTSSATSNQQLQTRSTSTSRDTAGRPVRTILPDGSLEYTFYDKQNRLGYKVSPTGIVTCNQYDRVHCYKSTTVYNTQINPSKLQPINPVILPPAFLLISLITTSPYDRTTYQFFDASDRLQYEVDENLVVTQTIYDQLNRKTASITYATPLTNDQLSALKQGTAINLSYDPTQDRCARIFYDNDGNEIGLQDPAGYVTEFVLDAGGRVAQQIKYATPVTPNLGETSFNQIRPTPDPSNDARSYYFRDARGNCIAQVDPAGYLTQSIYLPNGQVQQKTKFATVIPASWFTNPTSPPPTPPTTTEDQTRTYQYDLMNRPIQIEGPFGQRQILSYDAMGNTTLDQTVDVTNLALIDPDHQRNTQKQYDGWEQVVAQANPFVGQLIAAIMANPNYSPQQKTDQVNQVWATQSARSTYDATGLLLTVVDPLGNQTYFYYDQERRPIFVIGPTGAVVQTVNNVFGEVTQITKYATALTAAQLATLAGGLITVALQTEFTALANPAVDQTTVYVRDQRGLITQITDPEGYITTKTYTAFKQVATEIVPVANQQPSLTIQHSYEPRGLETQVVKTASNQTLTKMAQYQNLYGKCTQITLVNSFGNQVSQFVYDPKGRLLQEINPANVIITTQTYDAFDREISKIDAANNQTLMTYNQTARSKTVAYPKAGVTITQVANVFGEPIQEINGIVASQFWQHTSDGKVVVHIDFLSNQTSYTFNLIGLKSSETNAAGIRTSYSYNGAKQLTNTVVDVTGLKLSTIFSPDVFGNNLTITDPKNIITANTFDRRDLLLTAVRDPNNGVYVGLNLIVTNSYNGQRTLVTRQESSTAGPLTYLESYSVDCFNRVYGKSKDPNGLNLTSTNVLDQVGNVIAKTDQYGNVSRTFYDICNRECFSVNAKGAVVATTYNLQGLRSSQREYATAINPQSLNNASIMADLQVLLNPTSFDTMRWYFYDTNNQEQFIINSFGAITEKIYNSAMQLVATTQYKTPIDVSQIPNLTTAQLVTFTQNNATTKDRHTYFILDQGGQICFTISSRGVVTEKCYDPMGRVFTQIIYATRLTNTSQYFGYTPEQFFAVLPKDPLNDRATYTVFDNIGNPHFVVSSTGGVIRFDHDPNNNLIIQNAFTNPIVIPDDYQDLVTLLNTLVPNPAVDRIELKQVDNANRVYKITDPIGFTQIFNFNEVNKIKDYTNKNGNTFNYGYDTAKRKTQEIAPAINVSGVTYTPNVGTKYGSLTGQTTNNINVTTNTTYSSNNPSLIITEGYGLVSAVGAPRTCLQSIDAMQLLTGTAIANVTLDDPALPASFITLPQTQTSTSTQIIYDPRSNGKQGEKQMPLSMKSEGGQWSFILYDAEKRPIFTVDARGAVTGIVYDIFGDDIEETQYANLLGIDLVQYSTTGLPLGVLQGNLDFDPTNDRVKKIEHTHETHEKEIKQKDIFYGVPHAESPTYGVADSITKIANNTFGECIYQAKLINAATKQWQEQWYWNDQLGMPIATVDSDYFVKIFQNNVFGEEISRTEYGNALANRPALGTTFTQLQAAITTSSTDRLYLSQRNLRGEITQTIQKSVLVQDMSLVNRIPQLSSSRVDAITLTQYSGTGKPIAVTSQYQAGSNLITLGTAYQYFDACDNLIASTDIARVSKDNQGNAITLIPLTYYGVNAYGQRVITAKYFNGTTNPSISQVPTPTALDPNNDQYFMEYLDSRGLTVFKQDPLYNLFGKTYTADRKIARTWHRLTNQVKVKGATQLQPSYEIDECRYIFDAVDNPISECIYRNGILKQTTLTQYNAFNQKTAQGGEDNKYPAFWRYDVKGRIWMHNPNGENTVLIYDLADRETTQIRSANVDISFSTYPTLINLVNLDITKIQKTEYVRTGRGMVAIEMSPAYYGSGEQSSTPIPLSMMVGTEQSFFGSTSITWVQPQERNVTAHFYLNPVANPSAQQELPIIVKNGVCGVDVGISTLSSDVYQFTINYVLNNPLDPSAPSIFTYITTGSLQFDNGTSAASTATVVSVTRDNQLILGGKTTGISQINLWQGGVAKGQYPVNNNLVDLSSVLSGTYTLQPVVAGQAGTMSLPFTIYTMNPSTTPLAQEIDCNFQLSTSGQSGQMMWQVPSLYAQQTVQVSINYLDNNNTQHTQAATINPISNPTGNIQFDYPVQSITSLTVQLLVLSGATSNQDVWITLANNLAPLSAGKAIKSSSIGDPLTTNFPARIIQYVNALPTFATAPKNVVYLNTTLDTYAEWIDLPVLQSGTDFIVLDVSNLTNGCYPLHVEHHTNLSFTIGQGSAVYPSNDFPGIPSAKTILHQAQPTLVHPKKYRTWDAWENKLSEGNKAGELTNYTYNDFNQILTQIAPFVDVYSESGQKSSLQPTTTWGYSVQGYRVGETDPNGHTQGWVMDAVGQELQEILADGTVSQQSVYDIFRRLSWYLDSRSLHHNQTWNRNNKITSVVTPMQATTTFAYNELNHRTTVTDANNHTTTTNYSAEGYINERYEPGGELTSFVRDRLGLETEVNITGGGRSLWERDYFGVIGSHTDSGGHVCKYEYNYRRQRTRSYTSVGNYGNYCSMEPVEGYFKLVYDAKSRTVPRQNLEFTYRVDQLIEVNDKANNQRSVYDFTTDGTAIALDIYQGDQRIRMQRSAVDALNRLMNCSDGWLTLSYGYDAVGNRRFVGVNYGGLNSDIGKKYWNTFTPANCILIDGGKLKDGVILRGEGAQYTYTNGVRATETVSKGTVQVTVTLGFNNDGQLTTTKATDGSTSNYTQDKVGLPKSYSNSAGESQTYERNSNGFTTKQTAKAVTGDTTTAEFQQLTPWGDPQVQVTTSVSKDGKSKITDNLNLTYINREQMLPSVIAGTRTTTFDGKSETSKLRTLEEGYNAEGNLVSAKGVQGPEPNDDLILTYLSTPLGQFLEERRYKKYTYPKDKYAPHGNVYTYSAPDGMVLGTFSTTDMKEESIRRGIHSQRPVVLNNGRGGMVSYLNIDPSDFLLPKVNAFKVASPTASLSQQRTITLKDGDDPETMKIWDVTYPLQPPSKYIVMFGDTLASIATKLYGNASYAGLIGAPNALSPSDTLEVGSRLQIPQLIISHNNSGTSVPYYQLMQKMIGSLYPYLETPTFKPHISFWQALLPAFIEAFAIAIATMIPGFGTGIGAALHALVVGAAAAALDSAGQLVAMSVGAQEDYSWQESASVGIAAATLAGTASLFGTQSAKTATQITTRQIMLQAGSTAISQQVAEIGIGIRNKFDLTSIATAILSSGMTANLPTSNVMLRSRVGTLLACTINPMLQKGKVNVELIAAQALGALAGQEAAVGLAGAIETGWRNLTRYRQAQQAARGVGGVSPDDGMQRYEDDETQGMRPKPKSVYKAEPSKKEWAEMQFEGWEGDQQRWLSAQVSEDLKPPEIHWADGGQPSTDEEQVASYQRKQQLQAKPSALITYGKLAETFRVNAEKALFAPFEEVGSIFQNPTKAFQYIEMLGVASTHPIHTAKVVGMTLMGETVQALNTIEHGDGQSQAALMGSLTGSFALGGILKGVGLAGSIKITGKATNGGIGVSQSSSRFIELASSATKDAVRELILRGNNELNPQQLSKIKDLLGSGRMDKIDIKITPSGNVRFTAQRAGRSGGYQRMSFEIDKLGRTVKVVQTAFDDSQSLVRQRPGEIKNNLYDVKKWNKPSY